MPTKAELDHENLQAHNQTRQITDNLIAIASAINFARAHFSEEDDWTKMDEIICKFIGPLTDLLCETAESLAIARKRQEASSQALREYFIALQSENSNDRS
jgi:hypothetical protein